MGANVVHFAIHADDVERARRFYESVFGWRFEAWGPPGFYNVDTATSGRPGIHGALHARSEPLSGSGMRGFTCTVAVENLTEIRDRVVANGGSVQHDEIEIPTVGRHIGLLDTEGNEFAVMVYDRPMFGA